MAANASAEDVDFKKFLLEIDVAEIIFESDIFLFNFIYASFFLHKWHLQVRLCQYRPQETKT